MSDMYEKVSRPERRAPPGRGGAQGNYLATAVLYHGVWVV